MRPRRGASSEGCGTSGVRRASPPPVAVGLRRVRRPPCRGGRRVRGGRGGGVAARLALRLAGAVRHGICLVAGGVCTPRDARAAGLAPCLVRAHGPPAAGGPAACRAARRAARCSWSAARTARPRSPSPTASARAPRGWCPAAGRAADRRRLRRRRAVRLRGPWEFPSSPRRALRLAAGRAGSLGGEAGRWCAARPALPPAGARMPDADAAYPRRGVRPVRRRAAGLRDQGRIAGGHWRARSAGSSAAGSAATGA